MTMYKNFLAIALIMPFSVSMAFAQQNQSNQDGSNQDSQQNQDEDPWLKFSSEGWVRIATDYDDDGKYDASGTVYLEDLMNALKMSKERQRKEQERRTSARPTLRDRRDDRGFSSRSSRDRGQRSSRSSDRNYRISGTIREINDVNLFGTDEKQHQVARVKTSDGRTAKVLLGPKSQLEKFNLSQGDRITVNGKQGRVNDKVMLIASDLSSGDQKSKIKQQSSRNIKRVTATINDLRAVSFRQRDGRFVVAKVELENGRTATVHLGSLDAFRNAGVREGDEIQMLARPVTINGNPGLIAEQVSFRGRKIGSQKQSQKSGQQGSRNSRRQSGQ